MRPIESAYYVASELEKEKAKLVLLSGSLARGKINPKDLDITGVFENDTELVDRDYFNSLVERLSSEAGIKVHLIDYNERWIDTLIEEFNKDPYAVCVDLNYVCMDNVRDQGQGWPLSWIFGKDAKEVLRPYGCFQSEFIVLLGEDYLEELRQRTVDPRKLTN